MYVCIIVYMFYLVYPRDVFRRVILSKTGSNDIYTIWIIAQWELVCNKYVIMSF